MPTCIQTSLVRRQTGIHKQQAGIEGLQISVNRRSEVEGHESRHTFEGTKNLLSHVLHPFNAGHKAHKVRSKHHQHISDAAYSANVSIPRPVAELPITVSKNLPSWSVGRSLLQMGEDIERQLQAR